MAKTLRSRSSEAVGDLVHGPVGGLAWTAPAGRGSEDRLTRGAHRGSKHPSRREPGGSAGLPQRPSPSLTPGAPDGRILLDRVEAERQRRGDAALERALPTAPPGPPQATGPGWG